MAEEIGVPSLTLQFEKAPTRAGSREGGLPSRRSLYLVPTRGWGVVVDTSRAFTSYAERFEKEKYCFTRTTHQKWPGTAQKTGIEADVINAINSISSSSSWDCSAPALACGGAFLSAQKLRQLGDGGASTRPTAREINGRWLGSLRPLVTRCGREAPFRSRQRRFRWCEYAPHGRGRTLKSCRRQSFRFSRTR